MSLAPYLHRVVGRENLNSRDAEAAMSVILNGEASTVLVAAFATALRMKGETADEIFGFARAMRSKSLRVEHGLEGVPVLDTCGTGGDGRNTFNISTVAAFVVAGAGVKVAKHGNRSMSSQCGSADILEELGVRIPLSPVEMARHLREAGIAFLFAPALHPAMKHAQPARIELGMRTVFNLLGPLTNPAGANVQMVGAPSADAAELMAKALACLGLERGFVAHGSDGLDEITTTGRTLLLEIRRGAIAHHSVTPEDFGVRRSSLASLRGGNRAANCVIARAVLEGTPGPARDVVIVNSAAALVAAGKADSWLAGAELAARSIGSGAAGEKLALLTRLSHEAAVAAPGA